MFRVNEFLLAARSSLGIFAFLFEFRKFIRVFRPATSWRFEGKWKRSKMQEKLVEA